MIRVCVCWCVCVCVVGGCDCYWNIYYLFTFINWLCIIKLQNKSRSTSNESQRAPLSIVRITIVWVDWLGNYNSARQCRIHYDISIRTHRNCDKAMPKLLYSDAVGWLIMRNVISSFKPLPHVEFRSISSFASSSIPSLNCRTIRWFSGRVSGGETNFKKKFSFETLHRTIM